MYWPSTRTRQRNGFDTSAAPDLTAASITTSRGQLPAMVRFAQDAFNPNKTSVRFLLDIDQSAATGHPAASTEVPEGLITVDGTVYARG